MQSDKPSSNRSEIDEIESSRPEMPGNIVINIPPIAQGLHALVTVIGYGSGYKGCKLRNEAGEMIAWYDSKRNARGITLVGLDVNDGACTLELIGVATREPWSPMAASHTLPTGAEIWSRVYSYTGTTVLDEKILITIMVQAGVLPDDLQKNRVVIL